MDGLLPTGDSRCCGIRSQWKPGGALFLADFLQEGALVLCQDFTPKLDANLLCRSSDLMDCMIWVGLIYHRFMSPPGLFHWDRLHKQLSLSDSGVLAVTGVRSDVSGMGLVVCR